jgi:hypothetical protein
VNQAGNEAVTISKTTGGQQHQHRSQHMGPEMVPAHFDQPVSGVVEQLMEHCLELPNNSPALPRLSEIPDLMVASRR